MQLSKQATPAANKPILDGLYQPFVQTNPAPSLNPSLNHSYIDGNVLPKAITEE